MLGHRELSVEDYFAIVRRRLWIIALSTVAVAAVAIGTTYVLPPIYESQTLILIEQQQVPQDYVKPVIDQDLVARLASMKEQILSRSRLEPIITRYALYAGGNRPMEDRVELTRKAIKVTQIHSEQARGGMPGFFVYFQASDAHTAQQVCGEITSLFVTANLNAREQYAEGTTGFLKQQVDDAKRSLDEQDARLADFEVKNFGRLPDQSSSNANTLQTLTTQLDAATQTVNRLQQNETFLEALIAQQSHELPSSDGSGGLSPDERQNELNALIKQRQQLETVYTSDYPDVVELTRKINKLRAEAEHTPRQQASHPSGGERIETPQLQQLKAQLHASQQSIANAHQEQARLQQEIRSYETKIESSPLVEQEYKKITRDHETAVQFYNGLLAKLNESSMATALEHRQQGEQFSVMDPPNLPDSPKFPNRNIFAGGGLVGGLVLGLLITALLEYRDTSIRNEKDIWAFTKLPTLAVISKVENIEPANAARPSIFGKLPSPALGSTEAKGH